MTYSIKKRDFRRSQLLKEIADAQGDSQQGSNAVKKIFTSLGSAVSIPFPRRDIPWEETSEGRRYRIRLLPQNPFFLEDVEVVREWLGIPDGLFDVTDEARELAESLRDSGGSDSESHNDQEPESVAGFRFVKSRSAGTPLPDAAIENDLFVRFIRAYTLALDSSGDDMSKKNGLGVEIDESAQRAANAFEQDRPKPKWIERPGDPVTCIVEALLYRYRLPGWINSAVTRYLIIGNNENLTDLPVDIAVASRGDYDYQHDGFDVTVRGVDEFMDLKTWTELFDQTVKPIVDSYLEARGNRITPKVGTPVCGYMQYLGVLEEYARGSQSLERVISGHYELEMDQRTIERRVRELEALLKPRGKEED